MSDTWAALIHEPGPAAAAGTRLRDDPRIRDHYEFLGRTHAAGYLVAAGPSPDTDGEGRTVLRLPGEGRLADIELLARTDDASVANGFLTVTVRRWDVAMHALD